MRLTLWLSVQPANSVLALAIRLALSLLFSNRVPASASESVFY